MNNFQLETLLNNYLCIQSIKDYCPNGLQIEGKQKVQKVVTGVTSSQALIDKAVELEADALLVHHGFFWKGEPESLVGMKGNRIRTLIKNDINLLAYHLPLDKHPVLGNNVLLAKMLGITIEGGLDANDESAIALYGSLAEETTGERLSQLLSDKLERQPLHIAPASNKPIKRIGWCSGGAQDYIDYAVAKGLDAFITGEVSERTTHIARENDLHFFAAGHHATEKCGVKALGEWLQKEHGFDVTFVDIHNPV